MGICSIRQIEAFVTLFLISLCGTGVELCLTDLIYFGIDVSTSVGQQDYDELATADTT